MSEYITIDANERIFILNNIELLAAIFRGPDSQGWSDIFAVGLPELIAQVPKGAAHFTDSLARLQEAKPSDGEMDDALLETEYVRLFIAAGGGVTAPLYESCHTGSDTQVMGDSAKIMRSRLDAAGLEVSLASNEPPDHLIIELEYLYHLLATSWSEDQPELEKTARNFAEETMLPWTACFRDALVGGEPHPVYLSAADHLVAVLQSLMIKS